MYSPLYLYVALSALMLVYLSVRVIQGRTEFKIGMGDGGNAEMARRMRVQANFIEYVPMALILIYAVHVAGFSVWIVHALGVTLILARIAHAAGLGTSSGISNGRVLGTGATFAVLFFGGILTLLAAFNIRF